MTDFGFEFYVLNADWEVERIDDWQEYGRRRAAEPDDWQQLAQANVGKFFISTVFIGVNMRPLHRSTNKPPNRL